MIEPDQDPSEKAADRNGRPTPVDLARLAAAKRLPVEFLEGLGLRDVSRGVAIPYFDESGAELFVKTRHKLHRYEPPKERPLFTIPRGQRVASYGDWRLDLARCEGRLILVEGESDCWALWLHDLPALGVPGANHARVLTAEHLVGIELVFIHREPDAGGETFVSGVTKRLKELKYSGRALVFSCSDEAKDPADLHVLVPEFFRERLDNLLAAAAPLALLPAGGDGSERESKPRRKSAATQMVQFALQANVELFHDPNQTPFATIPIDGRLETHPLNHRGFRLWLKRLFYVLTGKAAAEQAVQEALGTLGGLAVFDRPERPVHVRLAMHDGKVYVDLADSAWRAAEVSTGGWQVVDHPPVKFRRPRGMLPLPEPTRGGRVDELRPFVNAHSDDDWVLTVAYLLAALFPDGPKPVLSLRGQQGSAKSTLGRLLRSLVDPNKAPLRQPPRDLRDLAIAAGNGWLICLDNLSYIPDWLSDAICCLATGGGFATRELYTNDEEAIFDARRPVLLTSIEDVVRRGDLADRAVTVELEPISEHGRRTEDELFGAFESVRPRVFGALLDALSIALCKLPETRLRRLPRLADFATLVTAAESGLGWKPGAFMAVYDANRETANNALVEDSVLWPPLRKLLAEEPVWLGTAAELLDALATRATEAVTRNREWPKKPRGLSGHLRRLAPSLSVAGVRVQFDRDNSKSRNRLIRLRAERTDNQSSESSEASDDAAGSADSRRAADGPNPVSDCRADAFGGAGRAMQDDCGRFGRLEATLFESDLPDADPTPDRGDAPESHRKSRPWNSENDRA
jgi:hypothetical protein